MILTKTGVNFFICRPYLSTKNVFRRHNDVRRYDVASMQLKGSSTWRHDARHNGSYRNDSDNYYANTHLTLKITPLSTTSQSIVTLSITA
jgi:hypothetical protein